MPANARAPLLQQHDAAPEASPDDACPRCGADLAETSREVNLSVLLDDGAEVRVRGRACARCGWCTTPEGWTA